MTRTTIARTLAAAVAVLLVSTIATPVTAATAPTYQVTYVARTCATYTDVMANLARNNLQESLRDLGPDTVYSPGQPISATVEESAPPIGRSCTPLTNWRFTLGQGIIGKSPSSLQLSTVSSPYSTSIVTGASTPILNSSGTPTGGSLAGAVTVALTQAQVDRAQQGQRLWAQGGTPSQPLNGLETQYGFAALRCAVDNLNGDNVEWIGFPGGATHVFCYYYAVQPPPEAGTIIVRKELAAGSNGPNSFQFDGNISYGDTDGDSQNDFVLTPDTGVPASQTFIRGEVTGGAPPWDFTELAQPGWTLVGGAPTCTQTGGSGIVITGATVEVTLEAGDVVTCTYVNSQDRTGLLTLTKSTTGGVGTFPFTIDVPSPDPDISTSVTTLDVGEQVLVDDGFGLPGTYTTTETLPAPTVRGTWELDRVDCNGTSVPFTASGQTRTASAAFIAGDEAICTFENVFSPAGSLTITKTSLDGVDEFGYDVFEVDVGTDDVQQFRVAATTTAEGVPVTAVGDSLDGLIVGDADKYIAVRELLPPGPIGFVWVLSSVTCTGSTPAYQTSGGLVIIQLTDATPDVVCAFTNRLELQLPSLAPTGSPVSPIALLVAVALASGGVVLMVSSRRSSRARV